MIIVLAILISLAALLAVAYPILLQGRQPARVATTAGETLEELLAQRDAAFQALRDLNFDRQVGKIASEDFAVFEANLRQNAARALRALDQWETDLDAELAEVLRRDVAARRAALDASGQECAHCGYRSAAGDQFCTRCGRALPVAKASTAPTASLCPSCGHAFEPGDRFCSGCGRTLPVASAPARQRASAS